MKIKLVLIVDGATSHPEDKIREQINKLFQENRLDQNKDYVVKITAEPTDGYIN